MIRFSMVTPVLNASKVIQKCIESIKLQTVSAEHILIDGGSTDETLHIIKSHHLRHISEPDKGIYDAMNKGIKLAKGDVIGILNSDDFYADQDVLSNVSRIFNDKRIDSCYGDLVYVDADNTDRVMRCWRSGTFAPKNFYYGWMPPHPTFFVRRKIYEKCGLFNLSMGTAADYEIMLRFLLKHKITTAYLPEVLVKMRSGGVSNASLKNRIRANQMDRLAWKVNGLKPYFWTLYLKPIRKLTQFIQKT